MLLLLCSPALRDVASDLGCTDDLAIRTPDRGNRQGHFDEASILPSADGFVVIDPLTTTNAGQDRGFLVVPVHRNEYHDWLADRLLRRVAEELHRTLIPTRDDAVEIFGQDSIICRFNDRGEPLHRLFGLMAFRNVHQRVYRAAESTRTIEKGRRIGNEWNALAVWPFGDGLHPSNGTLLLQRQSHRAL